MLTLGIVGSVERMCLPVLFKEISTDLGLSLVSIGTVWGMDPLAGFFISLPGGLLADRFGVKRTLTVVCLLAGVFSALRGFSNNFLSLTVTMFLFGLMAALSYTITSKTTAVWFSRRYLGLTNALLVISWYIGAMTATMLSATVLSPLLGGWRNVIFLFSAPAILLSLLWLITGREPDKGELPTTSASDIPFKQALSKVIRMKEVWIIGLIQLAVFGTNTALNGYLPLYLRNIGWTTLAADSAVTILNGACLIGIIPMILISNRFWSQKGVVIFSAIVLAMSFALLPFVQNNAVFVLLAVSGFLRSGATPLLNTLIFEIKGVGSTYGGTAIGLAAAIGMLGSFAAPPLGASLTSISPGAPFIFWAILCALSLPLFIFVKGRAPSKEEVNLLS